MPNEEKHDLRLTLACHTLPPSDWGGYQRIWVGPQNGDMMVDATEMTVGEVTFTLPVQVRVKPVTGEIDFGGPYVHGKRGERFVYLCWRGLTMQGEDVRFRRAKIPLERLDRGRILAAIHQGSALGFAVRLTDAKGAPVAATLPPDATEPLA